MFLFQICLIALCSFRRSQTMITLETIQHLYQTEWKFMGLMFLDNTCYTRDKPNQTKEAPQIRCVSIPNVQVDYQQFDVVPPFTVTENLGYNVLFNGNSPTTDYQNVESFMAFIRHTYSSRAVNRSLHAVVEDCVKERSYVEAFIRLMNVIESEGISMLSRLCYISDKIITNMPSKTINDYFDIIDPIIAHIDNKFKTYFISTAPVSQMRTAISVVRVEGEALNGRKQFFYDTCMEFSQRYRNMMGLVSTGQYANVQNISNPSEANQQCEMIVGNIIKYFKKVTDAGPSGGGDQINALDQLQREDMNRQL